MFDNDARKFWRDVYKISNAKATAAATTVGGKVGDREITNVWKQHFEQLYCAKFKVANHEQFVAKLAWLNNCDSFGAVCSVDDVQTALKQQKTGKAAGPDGVHIEADTD